MKPKYSFFSNAKYALDGVLAMLKYEVAFRIELAIIIPAAIISFFLRLSLLEHLFLLFSLFLILIVETLNSSIEACVDLFTSKWHEKAKIAKDCASAAVFFSVIFAILVYISFVFKSFGIFFI